MLPPKPAARQRPIFIRDFQIYTTNNPENHAGSTRMMQLHKEMHIPAESMNFIRKVTNNSGIGPKAQYSTEMLKGGNTVDDARAEAQTTMYYCIDKLLKKTKVNPKEIDVLVTNCSIFAPTPSISAMIVNHYKMKKTIRSISLCGMGCSAGPINNELAEYLMQNPKYRYALCISTEIIPTTYYKGTNKSMILTQTIFRMGAAAILLQSSPKDCKYQVIKRVRVHTGENDNGHDCIKDTIDDKGNYGIELSKDIAENAFNSLQINMSRIFKPELKPEQALAKIKDQVKLFCFHTGGKAVLDLIQQKLQFNDEQIEASRAALWRYGNTSSASIWYELAYHESQKKVKKDTLVWQVAFGSGFKCNTQLLLALKDVNDKDVSWFDEYDKGYKFDKAVLKQDLIDANEKEVKYELLEQEYKKQLDENDYQKMKVQFAQKIDKLKQKKQVQEK